MAQTTPNRPHPWIAFVAGAVVMLLAVLLWSAWSRAHASLGTLRADIALPQRPDLPSLPTAPPPEGPRLPHLPLLAPR